MLDHAYPVPPLTHLVSDCDGVLIDSEAVALDAMLTSLQSRMADREQLAALIRPRLGLPLVEVLAQLFVILEATPAHGELIAIGEYIEHECDRRLSLVPGVADALAAIALPKAVASNSHSDRVRAALARTGLAPLFGTHIHTPDNSGLPKPDPAVYLAAAAGLGVAPGHCIAVEDSITGATAAVAAGMVVLGYIGGGHVPAGQALRMQALGVHATFDTMSALPELVNALILRR
ncbi:HAD-IA family hydrolase [Actimicrobium sp. CCC2.4]|uniref:HAD family hydrolase n=1 Tax=Actimicrobium sp. CCC2.4 TaxID=3048606 RepID=UPI002AC95E0C|nr:HAD-IA family hydrolase [Actimicrobium sp. CCC2.4]MEB0134515.1 HAD-IA family hydrolase [Actimicrobium sp. CCC2.4]WPX33961.1 HAD-IA family hydrolase [Actimicrobium sp. CCC2.4]